VQMRMWHDTPKKWSDIWPPRECAFPTKTIQRGWPGKADRGPRSCHFVERVGRFGDGPSSFSIGEPEFSRFGEMMEKLEALLSFWEVRASEIDLRES
jgi:hypothetical protein